MGTKEKKLIIPMSWGPVEGGLRAVYPMRDALTILHGPNGCHWAFRYYHSWTDNSHSRLLCTDLSREDVIYSGERALENGLFTAIERCKPQMLVVINHCIPMLIGDDTEGICNFVSKKTGVKIVPVNNPNYRGTQVDGFRNVLNALVNQAMGKPKKRLPKTVNIIGLVPGEYNWTNNEQEVRRLLNGLGLEVKCVLVGDGTRVQDIVEAPEAEANVLLYPEVGMSAAKLMEEKFGTPWVATDLPPLGIEATRNWLTKIAEHLGLEKEAHRFIEEELQAMGKAMSKLEVGDMYPISFLGGKSYAVEAAPFHLPALVNFLTDELSMVPHTIAFQEYDEASHLKLKEVLKRLGHEPVVQTSGDFQDFFDSITRDYHYPYGDPWIAIGSTFDVYQLYLHGVPLPVVRFSFPVLDETVTLSPFLGFKGACFLTERVRNTLVQKLLFTSYPAGNFPSLLEVDEAGLTPFLVGE